MRITISQEPIRLDRLPHYRLPLEPFGQMPESLQKPLLWEPSPVEEEKPKAKPLAWAYREGNPG